MSLTDPIADYLTRIRNACLARHHKVDVPASRMVRQITQILLEEGYIRNFTEIEDGKQGVIRIYLKYDSEKRPVIGGLERISKPGLRRYMGVSELPRVMNGYGIAILSTPKGIMTEKKARKASVGGEVICTIW